MTLYQAVIAPEGPLVSPLHSDTLFGAFCWSWLRCFGRASLERDLIVPSLSGEPPVIFSNGFPHGALPLPMGCYDTANRFEALEGKAERRAAYQRAKKLKGARFVERTGFDRIRAGDWSGFTKYLVEEGGREETTIHNMVSRDSGTVENLDGAGNLFGSVRRFFGPAQRFDCYILTRLDHDRLSAVLELMLSLGIGADKSNGCGLFRLESLTEEKELTRAPEGANGYVALSNFLPARRDPVRGAWQLLPKYPKLDREFAQGDAPFKKPLLFLKAGALFWTEAPKPWYGRCLTGVAAVDAPVTVNGCTIAVSIRVPEGV